MKSKKILVLVLALVMALSLVTFVACENQEATVKSIAVTAPTKTEYSIGDSLDLNGAKLTLTMSDDSTQELDLGAQLPEGVSVNANVFNTAGTVTVTVKYAGKTASFNVNVTALHVHNYSSFDGWANGVKPTVSAGAAAVMKCSCGETYYKSVPALTDSSVWTLSSSSATHTSAGVNSYTSIYGTIEIAVDVVPHSFAFDSWKNNVKPTENAGATAIMKCECGESKEVSVAKLTDGATWLVNIENATHEKAGVKTYTSDLYGTITIQIAQIAHDYSIFGGWKNNTKPTESAGAIAIMKCSCGASKEVSVAKLTDTSVWTLKSSVESTHTVAGSKVYNSSAYGTITVEFAKIAHNFNTFVSWKNNVIPTESTGATAIMKCSCGATQEVSVAKFTDTSVWSVKKTDATHAKEGQATYSNSTYGTYNVVIPVVAHNFTTFQGWKNNTKPTETTGAVALMKCSCGTSGEVFVPALTDASVWTAKKTDATHSATGKIEYSSSLYGTFTVQLPQIAHSYSTFSGWKNNVKPTESAGATAIMKCSCGATQEVSVAKLTDVATWLLKIEDATHEKAGSKTYSSDVYGTFTVQIPQISHSYSIFSGWKNNTQPTENAGATALMKCSCGATQEVSVAKLTNTSVWTLKSRVEPTHAAVGSKVYTSSVYGTITVEIAKIAHNYTTFSGWKNDVKPTESAGATAIMKCECGASKEVSVAKLTNTSTWTVKVENATHEKAGSKTYSSSVYGTISIKIPQIAHDYTTFSGWKNSTQPTETTGAVALMKCSCGATNEVFVPALTDTSVWAAKKTDATHLATGKIEYSSSVYGKITVTLAKIAHDYSTFIEWKNEVKPTKEQGATAVMECACGARSDVAVPALSDTSVWSSKTESASFKHAGKVIYTSSAYGTIEVAGQPKLATAFDGKAYQGVMFYGNNNVVVTNSNGAAYSLTLDAEGKGQDFFYGNSHDNAMVSVELVEDGSAYGAIRVTFSYTTTTGGDFNMETMEYEEEKTNTTEFVVDGQVEANGCMIFHRPNTDAWFFFVPSTASLTSKNFVTCHDWDDNKAVAYVSGATRYSIFIKDGKDCYAGVNFFDLNGNVIKAEDIVSGASDENCEAMVDYVKVVSATGEKIAAFSKEGRLFVEADGYEGIYVKEESVLKVMGNGKFELDGKSGEYTIVDKSLDAYVIEDGVKTAYYNITLSYNPATSEYIYEATMPTAKVSFEVGSRGQFISPADMNKNVPCTLPEAVAKSSDDKFVGWFLDDSYEEAVPADFVPTEDITLYAKWVAKITVTITGAKSGDATSVKVGEGDKLLDFLPAYTEETYGDNGTTKFRGWFIGEVGEEVEIEDDFIVPEDAEDSEVWAKWINVVTLTVDYGEAQSSEQHEFAEGDAIDLSQYVISADGYAFTGWYADAQYSVPFTATTISADTTAYAHMAVSATPFYGETKGLYISAPSSYDPLKNFYYNRTINVDLNGNVTGDERGLITFTKDDKSTFTLSDGSFGCYNAEYGLIAIGKISSSSAVPHIYAYGAEKLALKGKSSSDYAGSACNKGYVSIMTLVITRNGVAQEVNVMFYNDQMFVDVRFETVVSGKKAELTNMRILGSSVPDELNVYYNSNGKLAISLAKLDFSNMSTKDGLQGTYTGSLGNLELNGLNKATLDGTAYTYSKVGALSVEFSTSTQCLLVSLDPLTHSYSAVEQKVTLSFEMEGHGDQCDPVEIAKGLEYKGTLPVPTAEGFFFKGWYKTRTENASTGAVSYSSQVTDYNRVKSTSDVTIYAYWAPAYTVTFTSAYGDAPEQMVVEANSWIDLPTMPAEIEGKLFNGWKDASGVITGRYKVTGDVTIEAIWVSPVTLTIVYGNGLENGEVHFIPGKTFAIADFAKSFENGKIFDGLYQDETLLLPFTATSISEDTTVYAKWIDCGEFTFKTSGVSGYGYGFEFDDTLGAYVNKNVGKNSTKAAIEIVASGKVVVEFDYKCTSENAEKWDYFHADLNGTKKVTDGGAGSIATKAYKHFSIILDDGQKLLLVYEKDSSGAGGDDKAYVANLTINGYLKGGAHEHNWVEKVAGMFVKSPANCSNYPVYYKSCSICGEKHATDTFTYSAGGYGDHEYEDWKCIHCGADQPVSFITAKVGNGFEEQSLKFATNSVVTLPTFPYTNGKVFVGWAYDEAGTQPYTAGIISADFTLFGIWQEAPAYEIATKGSSSAYKFVWEDGLFHSNNKGANSTYCVIEIKAIADVEVSLQYKASSENAEKWDYLHIDLNGSKKVTDGGSATLDNREFKSYSVTLHAGDTLVIKYEKDGSSAGGSDMAQIKDLTLNGVVITSID